MEGETRLENHGTIRAEDVEVRRVGTAQICGINCSIGVEHLAMPHRDAISNIAADIQLHPSDHVLPEIKSIATGARHGKTGGRQAFQTTRGFGDLRLDLQSAKPGEGCCIAIERLDDSQKLAPSAN